jgi:flavodoxin
MKVLIIYFSLTDRTKLVAESIAAELTNHEVDLKSISYTKGRKINNFREEQEKIESGDLSSFVYDEKIFNITPYELICIGVPTWGMQPAFVFDAIIENCGSFEGKNVVVFATCRLYGGRTVKKMKAAIEDKGGTVTHKKSFRAFFTMHEGKAREFGKMLN